jgi:hypothetical protein
VPPDGKGKTPPAPQQTGLEDAVYFEIVPAGRFLRVTAIDGKTGIETSILGPPGGSRAALEQAALNKLRQVMTKQNARK